MTKAKTGKEVTLQLLPSIAAIAEFGGAQAWSRLTAAGKSTENTSKTSYNPFVSYAFLTSLEDSGSVGPGTGWEPRPLIMTGADGMLEAAMPLYLKTHSQGEYVFDHGWADAFERAGGRYYPKLQASVPFTPATGPRLMTVDGPDADEKRRMLAVGVRTLCTDNGFSSVHATFVTDDDRAAFEADGWLMRNDQQFHFFNHGYRDHDDFLATLASRKRKALKKERRTALENGISIEWLTGSDLTEAVWDIFFAFYIDTGSRKWGRPYLTRAFFSLIGERMPDDILLVMAKRDGRYIAGAINFIGGDCLYGRHWGTIEDHPFLHFEVCYHQAIDFALEKGLARVEAGAQGEHKLARGYLPATTTSMHYIAHPGLRRAVADYLDHERREIARLNEALSDMAPFRKDGDLPERDA